MLSQVIVPSLKGNRSNLLEMIHLKIATFNILGHLQEKLVYQRCVDEGNGTPCKRQ